MQAIEFEQVNLALSGTVILRSMSFSIGSGELTCILGASGCGKSTALRLIGDLLRPDSGRINVLGKRPQDAWNRIAYVFQSPRLLSWKSALDNVAVALKLRHPDVSHKDRIAIAERELKRVGLFDDRHKLPDALSGGQRQRVSLARALAVNPGVLLMDEPFSALDIGTRVRLRSDIATITERAEKTVVLVTHDIDDALSLADRVLVFSARPATILKDLRIDRTAVPRGDPEKVPATIRQEIQSCFSAH